MVTKRPAVANNEARALICLTWVVWAFLGAAILVLAGLLAPALSELHSSLPIICYGLSSALIALLAMGILSATTARLHEAIILFHPIRKVIIKLVLPLAFVLGRLFGYPKDYLMLSFVRLSNRLVAGKYLALAPDEVIVLLPQCLQGAECDRRITNDIANCQRCGRCDIGRLVALFERYKLDARVVPGGSLARKVVETKKPRAIIAIACERELFAGIQDTHPIPVVSVVNERPNGPCVETRAACELVEESIRHVLGLGGGPDSLEPRSGLRPEVTGGECGNEVVDDTG